jgi:hypothetical protein
MKRIIINKTVILSLLAASGVFAYNNWRQNIDTPVKQGIEVIEKNAATNTKAVSDDNTWNDISGYKYIYAAGMPVVYN